MATDYSWSIYDTAIFGVTAYAQQQLFKVIEGGDSTHTPNFTNMRGNGSFPTSETFTIKRIRVYTDTDFAANDREGVWLQSFLRMTYQDTQFLSIPLRLAASHNAFSGVYLQAVAALEADFGLMGFGYELDKPYVIEGGKSFTAIVGQGVAMSGANQQVKVALDGVLTIK